MHKILQSVLQTNFIRSTWRRLIHLWKPMAAWTLLVWTIIAIILTPISSAVLGLEFFRNDKLVIGNEKLISWLLSPVGMGYILLGASLTLTAWVIRFAGIFQIIRNDIFSQGINFRDIPLRIISRTHILFRLCLFIVAAALVLALPLAAGLTAIYGFFLDTYDINYYLSQTPLEWYLALLIGIIWAISWLLATVYLIARSLLALPDYLHTQKSIPESLTYAWKKDRKQSQINLRTILLVIGGWIVIRLVADSLLFIVGGEVIGWINSHIQSIRIIAMATGIFVLGSVLLDALISFLGFSHISTLITTLYYKESSVSTTAPRSRTKFKKLASLTKSLFRPKRFIASITIITASSLLASGYLIEQVPKADTNNIKIAAHRAGPPTAPENTIQALNATLKTDAEYAEIDVQLSLDSVVVVAHDVDLMRIANSPARISETNFTKLQNIVRKADPKETAQQNTLSTLDDFLESSRGRIQLMIELKNPNPALIRHTINAIHQQEMANETVLISMNPKSLQRASEEAPKIKTGYISAFSLGNVSQLPVKLLAINKRSVSNQLITNARQNGLAVYAWTINKASTMVKMIELGVDGIITDDPQLAIQVRKEMRELTATERLLLQFQQFILVEKDY